MSVGLKEGPSPELGLCATTPSGALWRHPEALVPDPETHGGLVI